MHELVIKNGRVALDGKWRDTDIGIDDGRVSVLGSRLSGSQTVDASGHWVLPGGIDAHCHLDQPSWGGADTADDFHSGSISAAFGGTTCMVPFAMPGPSMTAIDALRRSLSRADGRSFIDYGLHGVMTPETGHNVEEQAIELARQGVPTIKAFMTYQGFVVSDDLMLAIMDAARSAGATVMVHAENDAAIARTRQRLIAAGKTALRYHSVASAMAMEREATHRAIMLAEITGARVIVLHVSGEQSAEEVKRGRARGTAVIGETCPQYVFLDASTLDMPVNEAARVVFSPPPRTKSDNAYLWRALAEGDIALWSSDHSPYDLSSKIGRDRAVSFDKSVSGVPGLETRLPLLFSEGLLAGMIGLERYLDLTCQEAARIYGLDGRKGRIAPGFDADIVLWDPQLRWRISADVLHSNVDFTPFEGREVTGKPRDVFVRGRPVIEGGNLTRNAPAGQFFPRRPADASAYTIPLEQTEPWRAH